MSIYDYKDYDFDERCELAALKKLALVGDEITRHRAEIDIANFDDYVWKKRQCERNRGLQEEIERLNQQIQKPRKDVSPEEIEFLKRRKEDQKGTLAHLQNRLAVIEKQIEEAETKNWSLKQQCKETDSYRFNAYSLLCSEENHKVMLEREIQKLQQKTR